MFAVIVFTFFAIISLLHFLYLQTIKLDRCLSAKHVHKYLNLTLLGVNIIDSSIEAFKRPVNDIHNFADLEILSLIHISEPTRRTPISYAVFCLKKKKTLT